MQSDVKFTWLSPKYKEKLRADLIREIYLNSHTNGGTSSGDNNNPNIWKYIIGIIGLGGIGFGAYLPNKNIHNQNNNS